MDVSMQQLSGSFEEQANSAKLNTTYFSSESDSTYNCKYCLYVTTTHEAFKRHERAHILATPASKKESLYSCGFCSSKFVNKKELDEHRKIHVVGMSCSLCGYKSANRKALRNHVWAHGNKNSFQCLLCEERMTSRKLLDSHLNKHVLALSSCKWCRFTTDSPSRLKDHFQLHMKTKQIRCGHCEYFCFSDTDLKQHSTLHERKAIVVAGEEKRLSSQVPRPAMEEHSDLKKLLERAFLKCSICGHTLKSDVALQQHCFKHIQERQFSCHLCSFRASDREEFMNHVMDHLPVVDLSVLAT